MPSGRVHSFSTGVLSCLLGYGAYTVGAPVQHAAAAGLGALAGILLSPDLDVNSGSISDHHARELGGCWFGLLWALLWKPYRYLMPHRSGLSHFPLVGTAGRLLYLGGAVYLLLWLCHVTVNLSLPALPGWAPYAAGGLALSDLLHYILDKTL